MKRRHLIRTGLLAVALLAVVGCGSGVDYVQLDPTEYPEKDGKAPIEVYRSSVLKPHVVLGVATISQKMEATTKSLSTYDTLVEKLKDKARDEGADALVEVKPVYDTEGAVDSKIVLRAKVVRYLEHTGTVTTK